MQDGRVAVRATVGRVERFGPIIAVGPESSFYSPLLTDIDAAERLLRLPLQPDTLVTNSHNAFWIRTSAAE